MAENFECSICQGVLQVPYECPGCHRNFCREHINQLGRCPLCHRQNMPYEYKHNYSLEQKINEYPFTCSKGCGFKSNNIMELERHIAQCNGFPSPAFSLQDPYANHYQGNQINQYGSNATQYNKNMYPTDVYGDIYSSNAYTPSGVYNTNPTINYQNSNIYDYNYGNSGSSNIYSGVMYGSNGGYPNHHHNSKIYMSPVRSYNTVIPARSANLKEIIPVPTINIRTPNSSRLINSPRVVLNRRGINLRPIANPRRILSPLPMRSRLIGGRALVKPFSRLTVSVIH